MRPAQNRGDKMPGFRSFLIAAILLGGSLTGAPTQAAETALTHADQGRFWTGIRRHEYYTEDQGSRIMPLAWMRALRLPDGEGFLHDALARYGYLPYEAASAPDLPLGFTVAEYQGQASVGMTCAACHTRQLYIGSEALRIDGGPALADMQSFLADLDTAASAVVNDQAAFDAFAAEVLGADAGDGAKSKLRSDFTLWHYRYHTLIERSLPDPAWGPGRLDAVTMIFNRIAGLDIGEPPDYVIPENIFRADTPTRYPFLWNAAKQDFTQWPGFLKNGNDILGLVRNLGEVYGVFAEFHPQKQDGLFQLNRDYLAVNSANFDGLNHLEKLIKQIGPPKWPWEVDQSLANQGKTIFDRETGDGGCVDCHGIQTGAFRSFTHRTWKTPIQKVGTDTRECEIFRRKIPNTGVMEGADVPFITGGYIGREEDPVTLLAATILGAITQHTLSQSPILSAIEGELAEIPTPPVFRHLEDAFQTPVIPLADIPDTGCAYESRVLQGIWATAPYLHNGSVQSLAELLKPAAERKPSFPLGPDYDIEAIGLAEDQPRTDYVLHTTDCNDAGSGNSRCGHEYGIDLSDDEKKALLEYLKTL